MKMKENNKIWFPAKKHGIGWGLPIAWQGWVVLALYGLLLIIGSIVLTRPTIPKVFFIAYIVVLSGLLISICWKKGEKK
jgi:hypothetical protein